MPSSSSPSSVGLPKTVALKLRQRLQAQRQKQKKDDQDQQCDVRKMLIELRAELEALKQLARVKGGKEN